MNYVIHTKDIVGSFRSDLLSMESLEFDIEDLLSVAVSVIFNGTANSISMTSDLSTLVTNSLIQLPAHAFLSEEDREVLRISMVSFCITLFQRIQAMHLLDQGKLVFNCLVDDDMVLSTYYPLTKS